MFYPQIKTDLIDANQDKYLRFIKDQILGPGNSERGTMSKWNHAVFASKDGIVQLVISVPGVLISELTIKESRDFVSIEYEPTPGSTLASIGGDEGEWRLVELNHGADFQRKPFKREWKKNGVVLERVSLDNGILRLFFKAETPADERVVQIESKS